ncbi:MAG TPA: hypothetical protein VFZ00_15955 [Solirubrobacter sp.]|nr:hypothetical protein [Solirubrobacter sp.]
MSFRITVRQGPKVFKERAESVEDAIEIAKRYVRGSRRRGPVDAIGRRYEAADQVAVRIEIRGPTGHAGLDVHGDGGLVPWTGRVFRKPLDGDDPYAALAQRLVEE